MSCGVENKAGFGVMSLRWARAATLCSFVGKKKYQAHESYENKA